MIKYSFTVYIPGKGHFTGIWETSLESISDTVITFPIPDNEVVEKNILNVLEKEMKLDFSNMPVNSFVIVSDMD